MREECIRALGEGDRGPQQCCGAKLCGGSEAVEKDVKNGWKSLDKKKALKDNNLRAFFVIFCGERGCLNPLKSLYYSIICEINLPNGQE